MGRKQIKREDVSSEKIELSEVLEELFSLNSGDPKFNIEFLKTNNKELLLEMAKLIFDCDSFYISAVKDGKVKIMTDFKNPKALVDYLKHSMEIIIKEYDIKS